jgi:hypothetical protein
MFKLASSIGLALALAELKQRIRHWIRSGIFGVVGAVIAVIALCFLLVALHLYLSSLLNPIASASILGGVLLLIALILFFIASRPMRSATAPAQSTPSPAAGVGNTFSESFAKFSQLASASGSPIRNPLFQAAGVALIVGYLLGRRGRGPRDDGDKDDD